MQKHNDTMKTSGHRSLERYTSYFIERVVCEKELETEQNCNILTLMSITAFLSRSPGLFNRGPGAPASLGHGFHSSIFSPTPTSQSGVLRAPLCWVLVLSTASYLQLTRTSCARVILLFYAHSIQTVHGQGYILIFLDRMHLLFTQVHFLF